MKRCDVRVRMALLAALFLFLSRVPAQAQEGGNPAGSAAIEVASSEVAEHFVTGSHLIHYAAAESSRLEWYVGLKIVVTPAGTVTSATPFSGRPEWYEAATALAKTWQYLPFQRKGASIYATFTELVFIVPPEKRPDEHASFPDIKDWGSLRIPLRRTGCFGSCPSYRLTIFGNGTVEYNGDGFVEYCGGYRGHVSQDVARQLADLFKNADYFNLFDRYALNATDLPTYITSIAFDDKNKSVRDYSGLRAGMPERVSDIENAIDRLAGPQVWAKGMDSHIECESSFVPVTTSNVPAEKIQ
jgi:uncharacterized protein DUF6438